MASIEIDKPEPFCFHSLEHLTSWVRKTLRIHCHVKFCVDDLMPDTSVTEGLCMLTQRKRIELVARMEEALDVEFNFEELTKSNLECIRNIYSMLLKNNSVVFDNETTR